MLIRICNRCVVVGLWLVLAGVAVGQDYEDEAPADEAGEEPVEEEEPEPEPAEEEDEADAEEEEEPKQKPPPADSGPGPQSDPNYGSGLGASAVPLSDEELAEKVVEKRVERKVYTPEQKRAFCRKYTDKFIAYYDQVWKVSHCKRRLVERNKTVFTLQSQGHRIHRVPADVVAALDEGRPYDGTGDGRRGCRELEKTYITFSAVDVYYVENCKKRRFPDWATYMRHRKVDPRGEIASLSWAEFAGLKEGKDVPSVIDAEFAKLLRGFAGVDVIPIDEACQGVNNRLVSYYDKLYKIERCRKREILDAGRYSKMLGDLGHKMAELSSEQWLSLPDGAPIDNRPKRTRPPGVEDPY